MKENEIYTFYQKITRHVSNNQLFTVHISNKKKLTALLALHHHVIYRFTTGLNNMITPVPQCSRFFFLNHNK